MIVESSTCSRLVPGSASMPTSARMPERVQAADPLAGLPTGGEAVGPLLRRALGQGLERDSLALGGIGFQPGEEVARCQLGKRQQHVGEVALGIDDERRDAVERRLLDEPDEEAGLAAAGHADADGVRREPLGVHQEWLRRRPARPLVHLLSEIEDAQALDRGGHARGLGLL